MPGIQTAEHGCDTRLQAEPFVREDVQRTASGSGPDHAVMPLDHLLPGPAPDDAHGFMPRGVVPGRAYAPTILRI